MGKRIRFSLWYFVAAHRYLIASGDEAFVLGELLPVFEDIVAWHERGTRYGIRVDSDGLLRAGEPGVQLTDKSQEHWTRAFALMQKFDHDKGVADIQASIAYLRTVPSVADEPR